MQAAASRRRVGAVATCPSDRELRRWTQQREGGEASSRGVGGQYDRGYAKSSASDSRRAQFPVRAVRKKSEWYQVKHLEKEKSAVPCTRAPAIRRKGLHALATA
jgi:hypothetical protein